MSGLREKTRAKRTLRFCAWVAGDFLSIDLECGSEGKSSEGPSLGEKPRAARNLKTKPKPRKHTHTQTPPKP